MLKAKRLGESPTIGVFSSSSPISATCPVRYERGIAYLKSKGYRVQNGVLYGKKDGYRSGTIRERADEFNRLLHDDEVDILIWQKTDLGFKVIVDNKFGGMIFKNEIFTDVRTGMKMTAYIKQVRPDGKIDLELQKGGVKKVEDFADTLLEYIRSNGGSTPLNDKTEADVIYNTFGVSKKTFKKAVGDLYKKRLIVLEGEQGIRLA